MSVLTIETAEVFEPLLAPKRYKGAYGGRGSGKSYFFAGLGVEEALAFPGDWGEGLRWFCAREIQKSLKESAKHLVETRIRSLPGGAEANGFKIFNDVVKTPGDGIIIFQGMQDHTADSIKSLEGFHRAWVEEAHSISAKSWRLLRPTIREEGSEIWCSWNPESEDDPVDRFFRGEVRDEAVCVRANWEHNPWFPDVLRAEMESDYRTDPEMARHVWGGEYAIITEGAYYARLLAEAEKEDRVGEFPYDPERKVSTAWDIGVDDYTAIWFFQSDGKRVRAIDYYETSGDGAELIVADALRSKPYKYDQHFLPHDVGVREWGAGARTREMTLRGLGLQGIMRGANQGPSERINASRALLPFVDFNAETTRLGMKRLRNYRRKWNESLQSYGGPLHDENSHGADAFGEYAVNCPLVKIVSAPKPTEFNDYISNTDTGGDSWRI